MGMMIKDVVLIRGAGEMATGVGWALAKAGYKVVMTEVAKPLMVRWPVCFGTAVEEGKWVVEGITSKCIEKVQECTELWQEGIIPILVDPTLTGLSQIKPTIVIDAILAKRNIGTNKAMAEFTIGLGPGFTAGHDVHLVIETNRGHDLGRLIYQGQAEPNTGVPGEVGGYSKERVLYSEQSGVFKASCQIGDSVYPGMKLGEIQSDNSSTLVFAALQGTVRGLLRDNTPISAKVKVGDIDPRGHKEYCFTLSEKARAIGTSVLLAVLEWENKKV